VDSPAAAPTGGKYRFIRLRDVIQQKLHDLFPGMQILAVSNFVSPAARRRARRRGGDDLRDGRRAGASQRRFADGCAWSYDATSDPGSFSSSCRN